VSLQEAFLRILALQVPAVESGVLGPPAHRGWCLVQASTSMGGFPCRGCGLGVRGLKSVPFELIMYPGCCATCACTRSLPHVPSSSSARRHPWRDRRCANRPPPCSELRAQRSLEPASTTAATTTTSTSSASASTSTSTASAREGSRLIQIRY
jgi:hypothetical protein